MGLEERRARLIPVDGIGSNSEAESRVTSAFLAVLSIVKEFSDMILAETSSPRGKTIQVETFTEIRVDLRDGSYCQPDGLIVVKSRGREWKAFVEVKVGSNKLGAEQLNKYLVAVKEFGADALITISNELLVGGQHPTDGLNVRSNSKIIPVHLSWMNILHFGVLCKEHAGVNDPEQAWILGEFIRYMRHPKSGVSEITDMGSSWSNVLKRASTRSNVVDNDSRAVLDKWNQVVRNIVLRFSARLGVDVSRSLSSKNFDVRLKKDLKILVDDGFLKCTIKVPDAAGVMNVKVDLVSEVITVSSEIKAPQDLKAKGAVSWLFNQVGKADDKIGIEAFVKGAKSGKSCSLGELREDRLVLVDSVSDVFSRFVISQVFKMGSSQKALASNGFSSSVADSLEIFYDEVLQGIKPWTNSAPKSKVSVSLDIENDLEVIYFEDGAKQARCLAVHSSLVNDFDLLDEDAELIIRSILQFRVLVKKDGSKIELSNVIQFLKNKGVEVEGDILENIIRSVFKGLKTRK